MRVAEQSRAVFALAPTLALLVAVLLTCLTSGPARAQRPPGGRARAAQQAQDASAGVQPTAGAQDGRGPDDAADAEATDAESYESRRIRAGAEFAQGLAAYRRGDFVAAARHFEAAYEALPDPAPLFNMARSFEGANEVARAVAAYERYLAEAPQARDRAEVLQRLTFLRSRPTQVFVSSEPPGAFVFVDEDPNPQPSTTPLVLRLTPGPHVVVLDREGYRRTVRRFVARVGEIETLSITLPPDTGFALPGSSRGRLEPRVANRRADGPLSVRLSFLLGAARPWNGDPLHLTLGGEGTLFVGRSLSTKLHFERVEPDGTWTLATGDFGYVFLFEDLDLGVYATAGVGYGSLDRARPTDRQVVPAAGFELRGDWVFHPHLSVGLYFRATWRNFFVAPIEPLNSLGLSVSLLL